MIKLLKAVRQKRADLDSAFKEKMIRDAKARNEIGARIQMVELQIKINQGRLRT